MAKQVATRSKVKAARRNGEWRLLSCGGRFIEEGEVVRYEVEDSDFFGKPVAVFGTRRLTYSVPVPMSKKQADMLAYLINKPSLPCMRDVLQAVFLEIFIGMGTDELRR